MKKSILLPTLVSSMALVLTACGGGSSDSGDRLEADTIAPVITMAGGNVSINQGLVYSDAGATAEDNVDGTVTVTTVNNVDTSVVGDHTVVYTAVDEVGNKSSLTRTVTVNDITAPVITMSGGNLFINQGLEYTDAGATAEDNVDGTVTVTTVNNVDTSVVGDHTVIYTAIDTAGNESSLTRTVTVNDVTAPEIYVLGGTRTIVEGTPYHDAAGSVRAEDEVDGDVAVTSSIVDTTVAGQKSIIYTAVDAAGNSATAQRTVKVIRPSTFDTFDGTWRGFCKPTNTLPGATSAIQEFSISSSKMLNTVQAYASEDCTGPLIYDAVAEADLIFGGASNSQTDKGVCIAETVDADFTSASLNGVVQDPLSIPGFIQTTGYPIYNMFCFGSGGRLKTGDLSSGNGLLAENRPTTMITEGVDKYTKVDTIVPNITIVGHDNITLDVGTTYVDAGATATDDQDGDIAVTVVGSVDTNIPDTYKITYSASDLEGNTTEASRVVKVVRVAGTFATYDGNWGSDCIANTNPALAAFGVRAIDKHYNISNDVISSDVNGYKSTNCSGEPNYQGSAIVDVVYSGEVDEASCATGKAEKVDLTVTEARINGGEPLSEEDMGAFLEATKFPLFNLMCTDTSDGLREGDVGGEFDGVKESKRPNEMDMTGSGLIKLP